MRIAYFGGSFDPPHSGHLLIARTAAERLGLQRVLFVPTGRQPLKRGGTASYADRLQMTRLLVEDQPGFEVSEVDAPREGAPNYTVETVARLRPTLPQGAELLFLAGADSLLSLAHWRGPKELLAPGRLLDGWVLAARPGFPLGDLARALPEGLSLSGADPRPGPVLRYTVVPGGMPMHVLPDLRDPASATELRAALAAGAATPALPAAVAGYIHAHGLYGAPC